MDVESDPVAGAVSEEIFVSRIFYHISGGLVYKPSRNPVPCRSYPRKVCPEDSLIYFLFFRKAGTVHQESPRHVGIVAACLSAPVDHYQVSGPDLIVSGLCVGHGGLRTRRHYYIKW